MIQCSWYAKCTNRAEYLIEHPILGQVPTCERCVERHCLEDEIVDLVDDILPRVRLCESCRRNEATQLVAYGVSSMPFEVCADCAPIDYQVV